MSAETEDRALAMLQTPVGALQFADSFWPEKSDRPRGSRSLAGHAVLRRLEANGLVRRIQGPTPSSDQFVAADAPDAPTPPEATPAIPAELQFEPQTGEVVQVQRRTLGRLAAAPEQQTDGSLTVENGQVVRVRREVIGSLPPQAPLPPSPAPQQADGSLTIENGHVVRVRKEVLGPLPVQAPPPQQVPAPQPQYAPQCAPQIYAQAVTWAASKNPEFLALLALLWGATFAPDPTTKWRRYEEWRVRTLALVTEMNAWLRALGRAELPFIAQLSTPYAPPAPSYAPSYGR